MPESEAAPHLLDLTAHPVGFLSLAIFLIAYGFVVCEELSKMEKSKPVLVAAGLIWALIGFAYTQAGESAAAEAAAQHTIFEYRRIVPLPDRRHHLREHAGRAPRLRCIACAARQSRPELSRSFLGYGRDRILSFACSRQSDDGARGRCGCDGARTRTRRASLHSRASASSWLPMPAAPSRLSATSRR